MNSTSITLVGEDDLHVAAINRLLKDYNRNYVVERTFVKPGRTHIEKRIPAYNNASKYGIYIVIMDLDGESCPSNLIQNCLNGQHQHHNLIIRICLRTVESWLLADKRNLAKYLQISETLIPNGPEHLNRPKDVLIKCSSNSRSHTIKGDIPPVAGSTSKQGRGYNSSLSKFIHDFWDPEEARKHSRSLDKCISKLTLHSPLKV